MKLKQHVKTILNWERLTRKFPGRKLFLPYKTNERSVNSLLPKTWRSTGGKNYSVLWFLAQKLEINRSFSNWLIKLPSFCFVSGKPCRFSEAYRMARIQSVLFWRSSLQWLGSEWSSYFCFVHICCAYVSSFCFYFFTVEVNLTLSFSWSLVSRV